MIVVCEFVDKGILVLALDPVNATKVWANGLPVLAGDDQELQVSIYADDEYFSVTSYSNYVGK